MIGGAASGGPTGYGPGALVSMGTSNGMDQKWPMPSFVPGGTTTSSAGVMGLGDKGQVHCNYQRMTAKDAKAGQSAGVGKHHLFFVNRPRVAQWDKRWMYVTYSLPDLNKLLFNDSRNARSGAPSRYHNPVPESPKTFTAEEIREDWSMQGACIATEGADVYARSIMDKMMITETVGGCVKVYNYWGALESDVRLWLLLQMVQIEVDARGNTINGHYTDTSNAADRQRVLYANRVAEGAYIPIPDRDDSPHDIKRRREAMGAVPAHVGDPWLSWQVVPRFYKGPSVGPSPSELTGEIRDRAGNVVRRWHGCAYPVGRSGHLTHNGASPELAAVQREAAITLTHPFEVGAGQGGVEPGASIAGSVVSAAHTGTVDVYLNM